MGSFSNNSKYLVNIFELHLNTRYSKNTLINVVIDKENIVVFIWWYETQYAVS